MKEVKWSINVYVEDGPNLSSSGAIQTEAVDTVSVSVPATATDTKPKTVLVQPSNKSEIDFIYIKADQYGTSDKGLQYSFSEGDTPTDQTSPIRLDKEHFLTSNELIKLFTKSPKKIIFSNKTGNDVMVNIVLARRMPTG